MLIGHLFNTGDHEENMLSLIMTNNAHSIIVKKKKKKKKKKKIDLLFFHWWLDACFLVAVMVA